MLEASSARIKERMWPVEITDRYQVGHYAAMTFIGKPGMHMKCRRLDHERRRMALAEI